MSQTRRSSSPEQNQPDDDDSEDIKPPLNIVGPKRNIGDCEIIMIDDNDNPRVPEETSATIRGPVIQVKRENSVELMDTEKLTEKMPPETKQAVAELCRNSSLTLQLVPTAKGGQSVSKNSSKIAQFEPAVSMIETQSAATITRNAVELLPIPSKSAEQSETNPPMQSEHNSPVNSPQLDYHASLKVAHWVPIAPAATQVVSSEPAANVTRLPPNPVATNTTPLVLSPPVRNVSPLVPTVPATIVPQLLLNAPSTTMAQLIPTGSATSVSQVVPNLLATSVPSPLAQVTTLVPHTTASKVPKLIPNAFPPKVSHVIPKLPQFVPTLSTRMQKRPNVVMVVPVNNTTGGPFKTPTICTLERISNPREINQIREAAAARGQNKASTQDNVTMQNNNNTQNIITTKSNDSMEKDIGTVKDSCVQNNSSTASNVEMESNIISQMTIGTATNICTPSIVSVQSNANSLKTVSTPSNVSTECSVKIQNVVSMQKKPSISGIDGTQMTTNMSSTEVKPQNINSRQKKAIARYFEGQRRAALQNVEPEKNVGTPKIGDAQISVSSSKNTDVSNTVDTPRNMTMQYNARIVRNFAQSSREAKKTSEMRKKILHNLFMNTTQKSQRMTEIHHVPWSEEKSQDEEFFAENEKSLVSGSRDSTVDPFGIAKRALSLAKKAAVKGPQARVSLVDVKKLLSKSGKQTKCNATLKEQKNDGGAFKKMNHSRQATKLAASNKRTNQLLALRRSSRASKLSPLARIQARLTKALSTLDEPKNTWKAKCIVCKEKFADKYELHRHATLSHPDVQIVFCELCSDSFLTDTELREHRLSYHKITVIKDAEGNVTQRLHEPDQASTKLEPVETIDSEDELCLQPARTKRSDGRRRMNRRNASFGNRAAFDPLPGHSRSQDYRVRMMRRAAASVGLVTTTRQKYLQYETNSERMRKSLTKNKSQKSGYDYVDEDVAKHGLIANKNKFKSAEIKKLVVQLTRLERPVLDQYMEKLAAHPITTFGSPTLENRNTDKDIKTRKLWPGHIPGRKRGRPRKVRRLVGKHRNLTTSFDAADEELDEESSDAESEKDRSSPVRDTAQKSIYGETDDSADDYNSEITHDQQPRSDNDCDEDINDGEEDSKKTEKSQTREASTTREVVKVKEEAPEANEEPLKSIKSYNAGKDSFGAAVTEIPFSQDVTLIEVESDKRVAEIVKERHVIRKLVSKSSASSYVSLEYNREKNDTEKRMTDDLDTETCHSAAPKIDTYSDSRDSPLNEPTKMQATTSARSRSSSSNEKSPRESENLEKLSKPSSKSTKSSSSDEILNESAKIEKSKKSPPKNSNSSSSDEKSLSERLSTNSPHTAKKLQTSQRKSPKLSSSDERSISYRESAEQLIDSQPKHLQPYTSDEKPVKCKDDIVICKIAPCTLQAKSSTSLSNDEGSVCEPTKMRKPGPLHRRKFVGQRSLHNNPKKEDKIEDEGRQPEKTTVEEKEKIRENTNDVEQQATDQNDNQNEEAKGKASLKIKEQRDKNASVQKPSITLLECKGKKTYSPSKRRSVIASKLKQQLQDAKIGPSKVYEMCFKCKELLALMKKVAAELADKNAEDTAIKCPFCDRYFISMFHVESHVAGNHLHCQSEIPCKQAQKQEIGKVCKEAELDCETEVELAFQCRHCLIKFSTENDLNDHVISQHDTPLSLKDTSGAPDYVKDLSTSCFETNTRQTNPENPNDDDLSDMQADIREILENFTSRAEKNSTNDQSTLDCALCDATFSRSTEYVRHVREMHDKSKIPPRGNANKMKTSEAKKAASNEDPPAEDASKPDKEISVSSQLGTSDQMSADREYLLKQLLSDDSLDGSNHETSKRIQESSKRTNVKTTMKTVRKSSTKKSVGAATMQHVCAICAQSFSKPQDLLAHGLRHVENETEKIIVDCLKNPEEETSNANCHDLFCDPFPDDRNSDDFAKMDNEISEASCDTGTRTNKATNNSDNIAVVYGTDGEHAKVRIGVKRTASSTVDGTTGASKNQDAAKKPRVRLRAKKPHVNPNPAPAKNKNKKTDNKKDDRITELLEMEKSLNDSDKTAGDKNPVGCAKCNRHFANRTLLNEHLFFLHDDTLKDTVLTGFLTPITGVSGDLDTGPRRCEECSQNFKWLQGYSRHRYFMHGDDSLVHVCENCCKVLTSVTMVNVHICSDVTIFNCRPCNKSFATGMMLRLHNTEKHIETNGPHFCVPCNKKFLTKAMHDRHESGEHKVYQPYRAHIGSPMRLATPEDIAANRVKNYLEKLESEKEKRRKTGQILESYSRIRKANEKKNEVVEKPTSENEESYDTFDENLDHDLEMTPSETSSKAPDEINDDIGNETNENCEQVSSEMRFSSDKQDDEDDNEALQQVRPNVRFVRYEKDDDDESDESMKQTTPKTRLASKKAINDNVDDLEQNVTDKRDDKSDKVAKAGERNRDEEIDSSANNDSTKPRRGGWRACRSKPVVKIERRAYRKRVHPSPLLGKRRRGRPRKYPLTDEESQDDSSVSQQEEEVDVWREETLYIDENEIHQCGLCLLYCLSRSTLRIHMARVHSATDEMCQLCQKMYPQGKLIRHMIDYHINSNEADDPRSELSWQIGKSCNEIDMEIFVRMLGIDRLVSLYEYRRYAEVTPRLSTYPCPSCDKSFPSSELYRYHYLLHHDTMCAVCNIEYKKGHDAARHKNEVHGSVGRYIWFADRTLKALTMTKNFKKVAETSFIEMITRGETFDGETTPEEIEDTVDDITVVTDNLDYTEVLVYSTTDDNDGTIAYEGNTTRDTGTSSMIGNVETIVNEEVMAHDESNSLLNKSLDMFANEEETRLKRGAILVNENVVVMANESASAINDRTALLQEKSVMDTNEEEATLGDVTTLLNERILTIKKDQETVIAEESLLSRKISTMAQGEKSLQEREPWLDENVRMITNEDEPTDATYACLSDKSINVITKQEPMVIGDTSVPAEDVPTLENEGQTTLSVNVPTQNKPSMTQALETSVVNKTNLLDENAPIISRENGPMVDEDTANRNAHIPAVVPEEEERLVEEDSATSDDFAEPEDVHMIIVVTDQDLDKFNMSTRHPNIWGLAAKISSTFEGISPKEVKEMLACHFERQEDLDVDDSV